MTVRIQAEEFDLAQELQQFGGQDGVGGVVTFTGVVRNSPAGDLKVMEIEHYPAMTKSAIEAMEVEARDRWGLLDCLVIHRYGALKPGAQIMMVATASAHRKDAFEAAEFLMDYLKSRAPFWKKEIFNDGSGWVDAKQDDEDALTRWD